MKNNREKVNVQENNDSETTIDTFNQKLETVLIKSGESNMELMLTPSYMHVNGADDVLITYAGKLRGGRKDGNDQYPEVDEYAG